MMAASILMLMAMAVSREFPKYGALAGKVKAVLDAFRDTPKATPSETPAGDDSSDLLFDVD